MYKYLLEIRSCFMLKKNLAENLKRDFVLNIIIN